jgi:hypothetical protein
MIRALEILIGEVYEPEVRTKLYNLMDKTINQTSYFSKFVGLFSFQTVLLVLMVIVGVAFAVSCMSDLFIALGVLFGDFIYRVILSKISLYAQGIGISILTLYFKPDQFTGMLRYLFIFDRMTPLFGCIIAYIVMIFLYNDMIQSSNKRNIRHRDVASNRYSSGRDMSVNIITFLLWAIVAIYHNNWMVGVLCVMMFFNAFGFTMFSTSGGYAAGFRHEDAGSIGNCFVASLFLNAGMMAVKLGFVSGDIVKYVSVFETGVFFWGTLVGSIAMLIMADDIYMKATNSFTADVFFVRQTFMAIYCVALMYFGNVYGATSHREIGGTFLVLWLLDVERMILTRLSRGSMTIAFAIILVNLYGLKQLISWYPEYCIF